MDLSGLQNSEPFSHNRDAPLIEVLEWFGRRSTQNAAVNQLARISALLECHLGDSRERFAVLIERCSVANYKNFRVFCHGEVRLHAYSTCWIGIHVKPLTRGRWCDAGCPDDRLAEDPFARDDDAVRVNTVNAAPQAYLNAQLLQSFFCSCG